jgi:hypothetical protein
MKQSSRFGSYVFPGNKSLWEILIGLKNVTTAPPDKISFVKQKSLFSMPLVTLDGGPCWQHHRYLASRWFSAERHAPVKSTSMESCNG